jgi:hypothetical protein
VLRVGNRLIRLLKQAAAALGRWRLDRATAYCTVEPCCMCAGALVNARVERLVYGVSDPKSGACGSVFDIPREPRLNHRLDVVGGVLAAEAPRAGDQADIAPFGAVVSWTGDEPRDLAAVFAHGPALAMHDRSEAAGLAAAIGSAAKSVPVTAIKGVTGNMGAASGLAELAAVCLLARDGRLPPILNCDRPDSEAGLNFVIGKPAAMVRDTVLATTNAIGGQAAAAVVRLIRGS